MISRGAVVPADELDRLIDQIATGASTAGGSGLGLSVVDGIMKSSRGAMQERDLARNPVPLPSRNPW